MAVEYITIPTPHGNQEMIAIDKINGLFLGKVYDHAKHERTDEPELTIFYGPSESDGDGEMTPARSVLRGDLAMRVWKWFNMRSKDFTNG